MLLLCAFFLRFCSANTANTLPNALHRLRAKTDLLHRSSRVERAREDQVDSAVLQWARLRRNDEKSAREGRVGAFKSCHDTNAILPNGAMFQSSPRAGTLSNNAASSGKVVKRTSALHFPAADGPSETVSDF